MKKSTLGILLVLSGAVGCSSPARVEVRPNPLVLEGKGAKGTLRAAIFDEDGKELTEGYAVTWLCLDEKTVKVHQDGTVEALSSGKTLVDVEIVGTEIHGVGNIEVRIPSFVEVSTEELHLVQGQGKADVWAEVRDDNAFPMKGYLPSWKVDDDKIVSIEVMQDATKTRSFLKITPRAPGETYVTASYKELATDIRVTVQTPEAAAEAAPGGTAQDEE
jgi:hypothetical protein